MGNIFAHNQDNIKTAGAYSIWRHQVSMMAHSPPTVLDPVTNISLSDELIC